eukprot:500380_1
MKSRAGFETVPQQPDSKSEENKEMPEIRVFDSSTHQFLIYFLDEGDNKHNICALIMSIIIAALQYMLYFHVIFAGKNDIEDSFDIPVTVNRSICEEFKHNPGTFPPASTLQCDASANQPSESWYTIVLAVCLVIFYLQHDIFACIHALYYGRTSWKIFCWRLFWCVNILIIVSLAVYCAALYVMMAIIQESKFDAIMNCVGVLFIHDLDEKVYESYVMLSEKFKWNCKCCNNSDFIRKMMPLTMILTALILCFGIVFAIFYPYFSSVYESIYPDWQETVSKYGVYENSNVSIDDICATATCEIDRWCCQKDSWIWNNTGCDSLADDVCGYMYDWNLVSDNTTKI